jgi:hypothetical protein
VAEHIPLTGKGRTQQEQQLDREWGEAEAEQPWAAWSDPRQDFGYDAAGSYDDRPHGDAQEGEPDAPLAPARTDLTPEYPGASTGRRNQSSQSGGANGARKRKLPAVVLVVLIVVCLLVGFVGAQGVLLGLDVYSIAKDAKTQITALEALVQSGSYTQPTGLDEMRQRLQSIEMDLMRLQADIPFQSAVASNKVGGSLINILHMSEDLVHAGEYGVDAGQILIPAAKGLLSGLSATGSTSTAALTTDDLRRVTSDVDLAGVLVQQALKIRAVVTDADLRSVGLGAAVHILDKLDTIAPKLPTYLSYVHYAAGALPSLLGLNSTSQYLLFNQDTDEIRPTGGFMGNYALLQFSNGKLASGVKLTDIYTLDCPNGGYRNGAGCFVNPIPQRFAWLSDDPQHFGVRDSNLDPDFATSASYIEQNYVYEATQYAQEKNRPVPNTIINGVIAFTPEFIGKILDVIGPMTLPGYPTLVTSANLQDTIHYYHILYAYCTNRNYYHQPICKKAGITGHSTKKTFDSLLGSTLLHEVASAGTKLQGKVLKAALDAIHTRDLQIYFNDPQVEGLLTLLHADNTIPAINGDQLLVVDANVGASYANADLQEQITDNVTLGADGSATHNMSVTYTYPYVKHPYSAIYSDASSVPGSMWYYQGVLLVMTPPTSELQRQPDNCSYPQSLEPPQEPGQQVFACADEPINHNWDTGGIDIGCSTCTRDGLYDPSNKTATRTVNFSWIVPAIVKAAGSKHTYHITIVHQAGSHSSVTLSITGPNGMTPASAAADNPQLTVQGGALTFSAAPLTTDQDITVTY